MRKVGASAGVFVLVALAVALSSAAQEVLTNDSVLAMVRAGLPESVIVGKIRASQRKFDLSTDALIALKQAGVPDKVLEAMVNPSAATPVAAPPPMSPPALRDRVFYHMQGENHVELSVAAGKIEGPPMPFVQMELVIPRRRAEYRIKEAEPVFYSTYSPAEVPLFRLRPGKKDDRNLKVYMHVGVTFVPREEDKVELVVERDPRGGFRMRPKTALIPGEYGFVLVDSKRVWDFGVE